MDEVDVAWGVVTAVVAGAAQAALLGAFGDQAFTLPDELGGGGVDFFGDATDKDVVAVGHVAAFWQGDAEQSVLAVVAVIAGEALACAASFLSEVAVGVVSVVAPVQRFAVEAAAGIELADGVVLQAALFVVLVVADDDEVFPGRPQIGGR